MTATSLIFILLSVAADPSATVKTVDGGLQSGAITGITAEQLSFASAKGDLQLPLRGLSWLQNGTAISDDRLRAPLSVELADGSRLGVADVSTEGTMFKLSTLDSQVVRVPRRNVKWIRFATFDAPQSDAWQQILTTTFSGDVIVVRKANKDGVGINLDPLEGTILDVASESVGFDFDGDKISVKREKLEGLICFKPAVTNGPIVCRVKAPGNWQLNASRLEWKDNALIVHTPSGAQLSLPSTSSFMLDFRSANEVRLAELEKEVGPSLFSLQPKGMKHDFSKLFAPRNGGPFGGSGLRLGKQVFESGLTLHSPTTLAYRIPEGSRKFAVTAGISDDAARTADLRFKVLADQKVVIDRELNSESGRGPFELECDVSNVRRLTLVVESAGGLDLGDVLILGDARFVK